MGKRLKSCLCTQARLESPTFRAWARRLGHPSALHRKVWEWCYIAQALAERGMLRPGKRGLGFGVGREPLAALFAGHGCEVVATDQAEDRAREAGWAASDQHASGLDGLANPDLCDHDAFGRRVSFRTADMNDIPADLRGFDFVWSSCSLEHLGSIRRGQEFIHRSMDCLRRGGVAVHTTEFNLTSDTATLHDPFTVLFRKRDIVDVADRLRADGHVIDLDLRAGAGAVDNYIDVPPYRNDPHLKLLVGGFVTTSVGLLIRRGSPGFLAGLSRWAIRLLRPAAPPDRRRQPWEAQGAEERRVAGSLAGRRFVYRLVGRGQRSMRLEPGGIVGEGADGLETWWGVRSDQGTPTLAIGGDGGVTMLLRQDGDGVWRGAWLEHEAIAVELAAENV